MAQITKLFTKGLDTDTAPHLQDKESYSSAMNVHISLGSLLGVNDGMGTDLSGYNIGGDMGVLEPFAGNTDWTYLFDTIGLIGYNEEGAKCIGYAVDDTESISNDTRFFYMFIYTPQYGSPINPANSWIVKVAIKYDYASNVNTISVSDSSILLTGSWVLGPNFDNIGFLDTYFVSARVSGNQLIWTDGHNPVSYVDVNKDYFANNPTINELSLITEPGHIPLVSARGSDIAKSTSIQKKGLQFTYRIINEDNFTSVLAPYSLTSLPPWQEQLDVNNYVDNIVTISLSKDQIIPDNWKKVDIVVRYLDTNVFQVIRSINKYDNTSRIYDFGFGPVSLTDAQLVADHNNPASVGIYITYQNWDGTNIVETLDAAYSAKQFDNVPITSKSLEYASSRLFLANNLEGYDTPSTLITLSSTPTFTSSYVTPESLYPSIDQDPFYIAIKANGTDSWNWCVVTQIPVTGGYEYYLYPTSASIGLFPNSVVPAVTSAAGYFVTTSFSGFSTNNFMTLPQNVSIDNMRKLTFSWNMDLGTLLNHYPISSSTECNVLSSIMSEVNTSYSGSWATHTDFGVTFAQMIVLRYVQRNGSTTYDNLSGIYDSATYNVSASNRAFLPGTTYSYGMTFYDEALRKCGIQRIGDVEVPEYYPDTRTLYSGLQFDLNSTQVIPDWAKYYSLDFSKNNTMNDFISFVPDIIKFAYKDKNNVIVFDQSEISTTDVYYGVAIPIGSLNKDGLGYAFTEGDVCKFVIYDSLTSSQQLFYGSIIDQQSGYVIVSIPQATIKPYLSLQNNEQTIYLGTNHKCVYGDATSLTPRYQSDIISYIYTPQSVVNQEYEIAAFGEVIDSVTLGDFFSTGSLSYTIDGDTYTQARNADAGSLTCVSMNPYEKAYTTWLTDLGRYTPVDNIGQKDLTNQIRWSNIKIPNSNSNGLATFDALDVSDVDASVGPITSIILSTKEANLASRLVILCNSGSFIGLIGQAQIYSQDQSSAFLSSAPVIGTIQPITGQWGCISPQGVISYKGMVFWADALNREIIQLAGDGATPISQQKAGFLWNQVFRNLSFNDDATSAKNIKIGINPYTSEIFVTCPSNGLTPAEFPANSGENRLNQYIPDKNVSYVYNYQLNKWIGAYEDNPDQWIRVGDDVFSVGHQYDTNGLVLYKEFDNTPGNFNQTINDCWIAFPISEGYPATIEPLSVILMGQLETTNTVVYARDSSSTVNNNLTQIASWNDSNYATREGEKFAPVLRNRLSNNAGQSQVLTISPLVAGSGYLTAPLVTIGPPAVAGGTQATATAVLTGGSVTSYIITNPGTGYTSVPSITVAPPPSGTTATATITVGVASTNTYDYQGIKGDRIRSKTPWVQVTFPSNQQINFQGARVEVKPSSGH